MRPLYNVPLYNVYLFKTLHRGLFVLIQIAWIDSPYNVHLLLTYTGCLSQRECCIQVSLYYIIYYTLVIYYKFADEKGSWRFWRGHQCHLRDIHSLLQKKPKKKESRGHPDLNRGPLDLQSNALPLSYTPFVELCHLPVFIIRTRDERYTQFTGGAWETTSHSILTDVRTRASKKYRKSL